MLKLSKKAEYGLLVLHHLGELDAGSKATVAEIADIQGVPRGLLAKVMQTLKRAGVLSSTKGVTGGYSLARPLNQIYFLEVVRLFEEYVGISRCSDPGPVPCDRVDCCALVTPMMTLNAYVMGHLQLLTMDAFLARTPERGARRSSGTHVATSELRIDPA